MAHLWVIEYRKKHKAGKKPCPWNPASWLQVFVDEEKQFALDTIEGLRRSYDHLEEFRLRKYVRA